MAVYIFRKDGENAEYLKIGKAGSRSNARFNSQHYGPNRAKSSLAGCLLNDPGMVPYHLDSNNVGNWIRQNIHRIDILIDQKRLLQNPLLRPLEAGRSKGFCKI